MSERLSAEERVELRELFADELELAVEALVEYEEPAQLERISMQLLLHLQHEAAPPEAIADAIAELETRADRPAAMILATAELLLAPSVSGAAGEALAGLRRAGIEDEPPAGTGELRVASVRRLDGRVGELFLVELKRASGEDQQAVILTAGYEGGSLLEGGGLGPPGERVEQGEPLSGEPGEEAMPAVEISADELHAVLRDAVARHREAEIEIPTEIGLALPVLWRAAGGKPGKLEGIAVSPPAEHDYEAAEELIPTPPPSQALPYRSLSIPRNAPCPCGTGLKAKRCCLRRADGLRRQVAELEDLTMDLADHAWAACPRCYDAALARVFRGAEGRLGHLDLLDDERLEAALWIVWDGGLCEGVPAPLAEHITEAGAEGAAGLLAAAQMRVWRVERFDSATGLIEARCPVADEQARLETVRDPAGEPKPGALLVARSVPRDQDRYALLGTPPVVAIEARADFEDLLQGLARRAAGPEELWERHGGELLSAAWCWPEMRDFTLEGEPVEEHRLAFAAPDCEALEERLAGQQRLAEGPRYDGLEEQVASWGLLRSDDPPEPAMQAEPGTEWVLCEDDLASPPRLAKVELNLTHHSLWAFAPSAARLAEAERELRGFAGDLLGELIERDREETPAVSRRWQRDRIDAKLAELGLPGLSEAA